MGIEHLIEIIGLTRKTIQKIIMEVVNLSQGRPYYTNKNFNNSETLEPETFF